MEKKVRLKYFDYKADHFNEYHKNLLCSFYFSHYLKSADYVYALLYSRGYLRKSYSTYVNFSYITNLTEADKRLPWERQRKKERYIRCYRYRFDDETSCVVIITNKKKAKLQNLIKKLKVNFDCVVVYKGVSSLDTFQSNMGIYQYTNKKLVEKEIISYFEKEFWG